MKKIIIAIDGYSACGKSSTAKSVANALTYNYIDTGAMYRAVTLYFHEKLVEITNPKSVTKALSEIHLEFRYNEKDGKSDVYLNHINVEDEIRQMYIADKVSEVSAISDVRRFLVAMQQKMGKRKGIVMEGRDIGTNVFPEAELKIFCNADLHVRAHRRQLELLEKDTMVSIDEILANLEKRDRIDTGRADSPLRKAEDAIMLDTTHMTLEEQTDFVVGLALSKMIAQ